MLVLASFGLHAQIPSGYYDPAVGQQGEALKNALHDIIKNHHVVSYGDLLDGFAYTDCKPNGKIWDIYSNFEYSLSGNCGQYDEEGDCWNREHTWPQSWFNEKTTPRSDLFHVYPTDGFVNGKRGNYPYGEVGNPTYTSGNGSKLGKCTTTGYSGTVFEPVDEYKGDIARGFFYMSVRYSGEDSGWGTSDMTNKAQIMDWAMTMLLRWSDEDPVSDKEIARNNAVYGYQNNRNPFIDHPEYARMIWDPNWNQGVSHNITCATGLPNGSVSAPENAIEGNPVTIMATPNMGYMVSSYSAYKTGEPSTSIAVNSNGTFIMPTYPVTVSAIFVQNNTDYDITLGTVSHGTIAAGATSAKSGTNVTLSASPATGYALYSWYVFKTGDMNTTVEVSDNSFIMPAFNVTVMATFVQGTGGSGNYEKVTTASTDWSGEYLIVYEEASKAFNGGLETLDVTSNTISVTIQNQVIASNATTDAAKFTIAEMSGGYSVKAASGKYIGRSSNSNGMNTSDSPLANTLSIDNGNVNVVGSGGAYLRYNATSGQERFRYFKSDTYTSQKAIQLYKKTELPNPTHTIQFDKNGGTGSMNTQTVTEFEATALQTNAFSKANHIFAGWNTESDGSGTYYADEAIVRLLADLTLYAQWEPLYAVTIDTSIENGSVSANVTQALEDQTITLTATPELGYELGYWMVMDENNNAITVGENQFEMPASNVTVSAVFNYVGVFEQQYYLVTDADQLVAGRTYLVVNVANNKALGSPSSNGNNRSAVDVFISSNIISALGSACELTLDKDGDNWTLFDASWGDNGGYLYAASSSSNYLRTQATNDANGQWSIEIATNGVATIKAQGSNTRNWLRYNNGSTLFSCYSSGQQDIMLFIRSEQYEYDEDTTLACLNTFDKHTVHSGATLSASKVLGMNMLNNANYLVVEDGAQFVHYAGGLKATVKKNISAYSTQSGVNNGWHLISYPHTGSGALADMTYLTENDYDLYFYDEPTHYWKNQKSSENNYTILQATKGYLYANSQPVSLGLKGTLETANATVNVPLNYTDGIDLAGFNLVGNPFAHNVTDYSGNNVAGDCYRMNETKDNLIVSEVSASHPLLPADGFFVKATAENASITFNSGAKGEKTKSGSISLEIREKGLLVDRFIVKKEGQALEKLSLNAQSTKVFGTRDGHDWAVVTIEGNEQPVSFKAASNDVFTLSTNVQNLELDYLHLIDNMTGADINLLETPEYAFHAKTTDYASRFRLVFSHCGDAIGDNGDNAPFAFVSNGEIRLLVETSPETSLQIVDLLGRVVVSVGDVSRIVSTEGMPAGVCVLRLIDGENVRTQKIVLH